ncbi:hypothetical protein F5Y12DRAFT_765684 [Xylaria sp. FL1777]|nr:hypothetical protein F5Y12DRAFT_765684 [Xylaria sp. FL1777]
MAIEIQSNDMSKPLKCGFCGIGNRERVIFESQWSGYFRAVYCIGPDNNEPQLSGLALYHRQAETNYLPPKAHQRFDDPNLDPRSLITIRGLDPPDLEALEPEKESYAWGFHFHDSCWRLAEQASAPGPVDLKTLWRVLRSIPHPSHVPMWGHIGGFYLGRRRDQSIRNRFTPHLLIPSAHHDPFHIPELKTSLAQVRMSTDDTISINEASEPINPSSSGSFDRFYILPVELRQIILTYVTTEDTLSFRLSSRAIAATPLSHYFFQSRFWPGRELDFFFDAFLLSPSDRGGIDWKELYRVSKQRIKTNRVGLGERNRLRIWKQTLRPLVRAIDEITKLSELRGQSQSDWSQDLEEGPKLLWKSLERSLGPDSEVFGDLKRDLLQAEIELPSSKIVAIHVSFIDFFDAKFISGLAFETEHGQDIEIGYIFPGSEEPLLVEAHLEGFHIGIDFYGFMAISPYTSEHMESEYLDWAGETDGMDLKTLRCSRGVVRRIRATFDGFRMKSLHIPENDSGH